MEAKEEVKERYEVAEQEINHADIPEGA